MMAPSVKRGLLRLALILMIVWNLFVFGFLYKSAYNSHYRDLSVALDRETSCLNNRVPYETCAAQYEKSVAGYSQWDELRKEITPSSVAIIELLPPIAIGVLSGVLWIITGIFAWVLRGFGVQLKRQRGSDTPVSLIDRMRGVGHWAIMPQNLLSLSVAIVALTVSHYYFVSLPASNRARLQFEKDRATAAKAERESEKEALAQASQQRDLSFQSCSSEAQSSYWSYVKLNGREIPGKPGTYTAPVVVWNIADKRKAEELAECHRQYDPR